MKPCPANTSDGKRCRSRPRKGRKWCWFHDPKSAKARATAQANGGAESRNRIGPLKVLGKNAPDVEVASQENVRGLVRETIDQVRRGEMAPHVAQVVGQLCAVALKSMKQTDTDKKLSELDERTRVLKDMSKEQLEEIVRQGPGAPPPSPEDGAPN